MLIAKFIDSLEHWFTKSTTGFVGVLVICGVIFGLYFPSLFFDFLELSDAQLLRKDFEIQLNQILDDSNSITYLTFALNQTVTGFSAFAVRLSSLVIHLINTLLIYWFCHDFLQLRKRRHGRLAENRITALFVAFFFGIHPLNSEAVTWISARQSLVFGFLFFAFLNLWIRYIKTKDWLIYGVSIIIAVLLFFEQPSAIILAPILVIVDWFLKRTYHKNPKRIIEKLPIIILMIYALVRYLSTDNGIKQIQESLQITMEQNMFFNVADFQVFNQAILVCYTLGSYIIKTIFPLFIAHHYPFPVFPDSNISPEYQLYILLIICILGSLVYLIRLKQKEIVFGLLFLFIALIPYLPIYPFSGKLMQDSYFYTASFGLMLALTVGMQKIIQKKERFKIILTFSILILGLVYIVDTLSLHIYRYDEFSLRNHNVAVFPESVEVRYKRLQIYTTNHQSQEVLEDLNFILNKEHIPQLFIQRGEIFAQQNKKDKACTDFESAKALDPNSISESLKKLCTNPEP